MFNQKPVLVTAFFICIAGNVTAGNLSLADAPLSVSTSAEPNIMLLIDNSGSMDTIIESDAFLANPPAATQTQWKSSDDNYSNSQGNYFPLEADQDGCSSGYIRFTKQDDTQSKCLRLPDPVGSSDTRYSGAYINYLLNTYASGTNLRNGQIPSDHRMNVARNVASSLLPNFSNVRFGLSSFYGPSDNSYGHGATINRVCGSTVSDIQTSLSGLSSSTNTPLAEALYEVTRYFRGLSSYYHSGTSYTSPIQYRCQKNFTIAITDGFPTYDRNYPTNDPADVANTDKSLPDWDGVHPTTTSAQYPSFPQYSDGYDSSGNAEGATLYLDDIAQFANEIDMKTSGSDLDGISFNDPTDNSKFAQQNMLTYTVGFATSNQMLEDAAEYGQGEYYTASNAAQLTTALQTAINDILARAGTASAAAASTGSLQVGTRVYQARFNSGDWIGNLVAYGFDTDPDSDTYGELLTELDTDNTSETYGQQIPAEAWDAADLIPAWGSRKIISNIDTTGIAFRRAYFEADPGTLLSDYFDGDADLVDYLRGNAVNGYRSRTSLLGDIVNSSPVYVGKPNKNYTDSFELESATYSAFAARFKDRTPVVYVGANDGMLHAFDAADGDELMAYIPGSLLPALKDFSAMNYGHRYYVDGTPTIQDAFVGSEWRTILVSGLNKGGQSIFALDVTDPEGISDSTVRFSEANANNVFLWEFTDEDDADLGYTYSQPVIAKLNDNKWYAIFGSGYNNTEADGHASLTGDAYVFIVDLATGVLKKKISTATGMAEDPTGQNRPNGVPRITLVDTNNDYKTDYLYAGDLFGNLWKFDLTDDDSTDPDWSLDYKVFSACSANACTSSNHQPITTKVTVDRHSSGVGIMVYFGTGKYIETTDNNGSGGGVQSIYGIWDKGSTAANANGRNQLQQQSIIYEGGVTFTDTKGTVTTGDDTTNTETIRVISNNTLATTDKGWYMDLVPPSGVEAGERQITELLLRRGRLVFSSSIPINSACNPSGDSWLFDLKAETGSRLSYTAFDLNEDGAYGKDDMVTITVNGEEVLVPVTGIKTGTSASKTTPILDDEEGCTTKYIQGGNQKVINSFCGPGYGRQKWQQIFR